MPSSLGIVASGAQGFSPIDLSPALWLDASDSSTITASGSPAKVSQWNNKGSAENVAQATSANQPTTGATTQNGLNVLDFDGSDILIGSSLSAFNALHNGTPNIIAIVAKSSSNTTSSYVANHNGASGKRGFYVARINTGAVWHTVSLGSVGNRAILNQSSSSLIGTGAEVLTVISDADLSSASARSSIFRRSQSAITNNTQTNTPSASDATDPIAVGGFSTSGVIDTFFSGFIAEIVIVTGTNATEANRVALRDYLNGKWAVY